VKNYFIVLKNDSNVSYIVEGVHKTTMCSINIYFKDEEDRIIAAVPKDGFALIREVDNIKDKVIF